MIPSRLGPADLDNQFLLRRRRVEYGGRSPDKGRLAMTCEVLMGHWLRLKHTTGCNGEYRLPPRRVLA
jgi:hypothetical protein